MAIIDSFGRTIRYLRVSVTDRCNLRCYYCRPAEGLTLHEHEALLTLEEVERLIRLFAELGISRFRITGGEPLLRRNLLTLLRQLAPLPGVEELSLTTNGLLLARYAAELKSAGVKRVNISLDSLQPETFARITRGGRLETVLAGIDAALAAGLQPVKINMVVMRGENAEEIPAMVAFAREKGLLLRFIETMPVGDASQDAVDRFVPAEEILAVVHASFGAELMPVFPSHGNGPARYYNLAGTNANVGVISALSKHFCATCNRMRLTSTGALVLCLGRTDRVDLKPALRSGATDGELKELILQAVAAKPLGHRFAEPEQASPHVMSSLGG